MKKMFKIYQGQNTLATKHNYFVKRIIKALVVGLFACVMASCTSTNNSHVKTVELKSHNYSYRVKSLVMHFTAVNYERSITYLVNENGGVSSHYLIPKLDDPTYPHKDIRILKLVDETERAWHAGVSYWQGRSGLNDSSIGIEIVNTPECFEREVPAGFMKPKPSCIYSDFEDKQIDLLIALSKDILARNPDISPTAVVGHSDIAPSRKHDPGPRFPWQKLYEAGIGAWYEKEDVGSYWQQFDAQLPNIGLIQKALHIYGYDITQTGVLDQQTQDVLGAFQMHFLPWKVSYQADASTVATLFALLKKYYAQNAEQLMAEYIEHTKEAPSLLSISEQQLKLTFAVANHTHDNTFRAKFIGKQAWGNMRLNSHKVTSADIYINGQKLVLDAKWPEQQSRLFSIAKRTQNGINSIKIANIQGSEDGNIELSIPYPTLDSLNDSNSSNYNFAALDKLIEQDVANGFPGAAIIVIRDGKVIKRTAYGHARKYEDGGNLQAKTQAMSANTLFDLASNTKVFATTLAIMTLVDQGKLSLDAPIASYLTEYNGEGRSTRTIADMLTHASGYGSDIPFFKDDNPFGEALYSQDRTLTQALVLNNLPFSTARRSAQSYSDTNFLILGLLVERLTQMPLDEYVEKHIYTPLGLSNTLFTPLEKGRLALEFAATEIKGNTRGGLVTFPNIRDYVLQGEVHDETAFYSMQGVSGHAGLFSNIDDLAVLAQMLLNGGSYGDTYLFNPHTLMRFTHPEFVKDSIGLGWRLASGDTQWHFGPYASTSAFGHTGWTGTASVIDPKLNTAIIYLTNKRHSPVLPNGKFEAEQFDSANYGKVMALVYESLLAGNAKRK